MARKTIAAGLASLCLLSLLSGCASCPESAPAQVITACPTPHLEPTPYPVLTGTDNAALLRLVADYEAALRKCNADKQLGSKLSNMPSRGE